MTYHISRFTKQALWLSLWKGVSVFVVKIISVPINVVVSVILGPAGLGVFKIIRLIQTYAG